MSERTCELCGNSYKEGTTLENLQTGKKVNICLGCFMYAPKDKFDSLMNKPGEQP